MSILALDIAFANTGWAVMRGGKIVACGTIHTEKAKQKSVRVSDDRAARAAALADGLKEVIETHKPSGLVGELPSGSQSATPANLLGWASGVVVGVATAYGIPCEWISESDSKKAALGKRSAAKWEMMEWARSKWPDVVFPKSAAKFEHIADSLAAYNGLKNGVLVRAFG